MTNKPKNTLNENCENSQEMIDAINQIRASIKVIFEYGKTIEKMEANTIYLDGSYRGPNIDNKKKSYSFDHHADCVRMATLATCQQVLTALELGFDPKEFKVVMNDLDADGSLSLWLLRNPDKINDPKIQKMVQDIGFVDANGPVKAPAKLHKCLSRNPRVPQTEEMLWEDQELIDKWYEEGDEALPQPFEFPPAPAFGLDKDGNIIEFHKVADFAEIYESGAVVAVICPEGPNDTVGYTIGKKSDFVNYDIAQFLKRMNEIENGWGGGSTIGGAPRLEGGNRSSLTPEKVKEIFIDTKN